MYAKVRPDKFIVLPVYGVGTSSWNGPTAEFFLAIQICLEYHILGETVSRCII